MSTTSVDRLNAALNGRYRIESELGEGGMATVYLADDIKHERKVALKVMKPELAAVVGAERFLGEIKTTANLTHPHILPLFDSGEADSFLFYVMPYVEGESLRDRLDREHQLPVDDAVRIATNIAEALDYAHQRGVIHRDIKPANVLLQAGKPVISDFGIALAVGIAGGGRLTETGLSLGTPHYMSPEQATGDQAVGPATDTYALGCVLYEMLVGEPPFTGSTAQAVLGRIITGERPVASRERDSVPAHVDAVIAKALEKVPADRFREANGMAVALSDPAFTFETVRPATTGSRERTWVRRTAAVSVLAATMTVAAIWQWLQPPLSPPVTRFTVDVPGGYTTDFGQPNLAVSPDGSSLVFSAGGDLYLRRFSEFEAVLIPGTTQAKAVFFSPDGQSIGFNQGGTLRRMSLDGGPAVEVVPGVLTTLGATWADDGSIVYAPVLGVDGLFRAPGGDGPPVQITTLVDSLGETGHRWPHVLPGSRHMIYTASGASSAWADSHLVLHDLTTGERRVIAEDATYATYVRTGHLLYAQPNGALVAAPFDIGKLEVTGPAVGVLPLVQLGAVSGSASYTVSANGTIAFVRDSIWAAQSLRLVDRGGGELGTVGPALYGDYVRLSPDGRRVAMTIRSARNDDVYSLDVVAGARTRLSTDVAEDETPIWSPDGGRLAYTAKGPGHSQFVYVRPAAAGAEPILIHEGPYHHHLSSWSPDGQWLALHEYHPTRRTDVWALRVDSTAHLIPIDTTDAPVQDAVFSPDGRWLAYTRVDESGRSEIWVASFPDPTRSRQQVTTGGGVGARWAATGDELFFMQGRTLMALPVALGQTFEALGPPIELFPVPNIAINDASPDYDVMPDGQSFLVLTDDPESMPQQIHVIQGWAQQLLRGGA